MRREGRLPAFLWTSMTLTLVAAPVAAQLYPAAIELADVTGTNGLTINGKNAKDWSGVSLAAAGDVNGDGRDDLILGAAPFDDPIISTMPGHAYVVFGSASGLPADLDLATLDGTNGLELVGAADGDTFGIAVASGDINGDGCSDMVIGARTARPDLRLRAGRAHVVYGCPAGGFPASFNVTSLDGVLGFTIAGDQEEDQAGYAVAVADFNDDGLDDVVVGAPFADPGGRSEAGKVYVVYGATSRASGNFQLFDIDGTNGFAIQGGSADDHLGVGVAGLGDFNADGRDDIMMGASGFDVGGFSLAGAAYVLYGSPAAFPAAFEITSLNGSNGFRATGVASPYEAGLPVAGVGDLNGDGRPDAAIGARFGAPSGRTDAGLAFVLLGATNYPHPFSLGNLNGANGFVVRGAAAGDTLGAAIGAAGDVNSDSFGDLFVGAWGADPGGRMEAGTGYVILGHAAPFITPLEVSSLDGTNGFAVDGVSATDSAALAVTGDLDLNADAKDDFVVAALLADGAGRADSGQTYVLYGSLNAQAPVVSITDPADGSDFPSGTPVDFTGVVTDDEPGLAAGLAWTSDLDGSLGSGGTITAPALSLGLHTITAAVTDSFFLSGSDSIQVSVFDGTCPLTRTITGPISDTQVLRSVEEVTLAGDVVVTPAGDLTVLTGMSAHFTAGFTVEQGGRFRVIITADPCNLMP